MTDVTIRHRRWHCRCGEKHSAEQLVYLRDQRARVIHPGGDLGAIISGWSGRQLPYESWPLRRASTR